MREHEDALHALSSSGDAIRQQADVMQRSFNFDRYGPLSPQTVSRNCQTSGVDVSNRRKACKFQRTRVLSNRARLARWLGDRT